MHIRLALVICALGWSVTTAILFAADLLWWWREFDWIDWKDLLWILPWLAVIALAWPLWLVVAVAFRLGVVGE